MIQGFRIDHPNGGTTYGVGVYTPGIPHYEIELDVAKNAGVEMTCVTLIDAEELIDAQYRGIAYLTTESE